MTYDLVYMIKQFMMEGLILAFIAFMLLICIIGGDHGPDDPTG